MDNTPNLLLNRPEANRSNWSDLVNQNWSIIDAAVGTYFPIQQFQGIWTNSVVYSVGDSVIDSVTGTVFRSNELHTSTAIPTTFTQERVAYPDRWSVYSSTVTYRGAWLPNTEYLSGEFVTSGPKYAVAVSTHVSSSSFDDDVTAGKWTVIIDLSAVGVAVLPVPGGASDANKFVVMNSAGTGYTIVSSVNALNLLGVSVTGVQLITAANAAIMRSVLSAQLASTTLDRIIGAGVGSDSQFMSVANGSHSWVDCGVIVADITTLKALTTRPSVAIVTTPSSEFVWIRGSLATADDVDVVNPTAGPAGRYHRIKAAPTVEDISGALNFTPTNKFPVQPAAGGGINSDDPRISYAIKLPNPSNLYMHFNRGKALKDGRTIYGGFEGEEHGSADRDSLFVSKFITVAMVGAPLTLDGPDGGGLTTFDYTGRSPTRIAFVSTADDSFQNYTITGNYDVAGVPTAGSEVVAGPNNGFVNSVRRWWSGEVEVDSPSAGEVSFGRQAVPSNGRYFETINGGQTIQNEHKLIDGITSGTLQAYQIGIGYTLQNEIVFIAWQNNLLTDVSGTYRWINTADGAVTGWSAVPDVVLFNGGASIGGVRPQFYCEIFTLSNGNFWTLLQGQNKIWSATSTDKGINWTCTEFIVVAETNTDVLEITASSIANSTFTISDGYGDRTAEFPVGRKFLIWNSTALVHNGVYTVVAANLVAGATEIEVSEVVNSDTPSGQINMSGVVAIDTGTKTFTIGGSEHNSNVAVGQMMCINNSSELENDQLYTIVSKSVVSGQTEIVVLETIDSSTVSGRIQNAYLNEAGIAMIDELTFVAMFRTVRAGVVSGEQFVSRDRGATAGVYIGRPKIAPRGANVSHFLTVSRMGGDVFLNWFYHRRYSTGNAYSMCYSVARALDAMSSSRVWMPERCIVSTTKPLKTAAGDVLTSATFKRHGYPFVRTNETGEKHQVVFSIEEAVDVASVYSVSVSPEYQQFFGGEIVIEEAVLDGTSDNHFFDEIALDAFSDLFVELHAFASITGNFLLRVSENGITYVSTGYLTFGATGTATSSMPMHNAPITTPSPTVAKAHLTHCNDPTRATLSQSAGGMNNTSTSGGVVTSKRDAAGVVKMLWLTHSANGLMTGSVALRGRANSYR